MGLFGKAVPKTAGILVNILFSMLGSVFLKIHVKNLLTCSSGFFVSENFRALCTGNLLLVFISLF